MLVLKKFCYSILQRSISRKDMANINLLKTQTPLTQSLYKSWKIIIADDEPDVHTLTKTVLKDFRYKDRSVEFISTYTGEETFQVIKDNDDIAMVLLDVVMESDNAGLEVARKVRDELKNHSIQIVLRTGQPGYAPETDVVINYAINDYKEKTELTSKKLLTTIVTALRTFETLRTLEGNKEGLQHIIDASQSLFHHQSNELFIQGLLPQLSALLKTTNTATLVEEQFDGICIKKQAEGFSLINASGKFQNVTEFEKLDEKIQLLITKVAETKTNIFENNQYIGYIQHDKKDADIVYISSVDNLKQIDKSLMDIFFNHSSTALNNIKLNKEIFTTQKVLIEVLGDIIEKRYIDDPHHIKRVARMSYILAVKAGLSITDAKTLEMVSPMHDVGKIGIADTILLKPGKLSPEEFETMKTHSTIGYTLLKDTGQETLDIASVIAHEHHERWDGKGYPQGLKGEEISLYGRITALIDVYDALANKRCYKEAWDDSDIIAYFQKEKGHQFDPNLVNIFLENIQDFEAIQRKYQ